MTPSTIKVYTAQEVADTFRCDRETVYRWAHKNKIGYCPMLPGQRTYRFLQKHLDDFMNGVAPAVPAPKPVRPGRHPKYALSK